MRKAARSLFIGFLIVIGFCYLNRIQISQKIIEVSSQADIVSIDKETDTPAEKGRLGQLDNPPGYRTVRTGDKPSDWLYNRSHLIGYQFTGLNNEAKNLFTGTRQLNADSRNDAQSMVTFESEIADYLKVSPDHYVRYQVEPFYRNVELIPRGVHMQAQSITDKTISFNVYIFNVQDGWQINYLNGQALRIRE